jgi:hypothetical protein
LSSIAIVGRIIQAKIKKVVDNHTKVLNIAGIYESTNEYSIVILYLIIVIIAKAVNINGST